jgi:hypothetical protein
MWTVVTCRPAAACSTLGRSKTAISSLNERMKFAFLCVVCLAKLCDGPICLPHPTKHTDDPRQKQQRDLEK